MPMNSLERALINLADILSVNNIPYMIIGGMANAVWGEPRSTIDIDATIWLSEENTDRIVSMLPLLKNILNSAFMLRFLLTDSCLGRIKNQ
jgi:hypothetical protein